MLKGIKVQLYPTKSQSIYMDKLLGCYRKVYNLCLDLKKDTYLKDKTNLGLSDLGKYFHQEITKSPDYSYLNEHNTKVLKQSIIDLLDSYKRFFVNGTGFPKYKSRKDNKYSCRFPIEAISVRNDYLSNRLTITSNLKNLKFRCSDRYKNYLDKNKKGIKSATLTKTCSGKYFLSFVVDGELSKQLKPSNNIIGIDLGIKTFVVDSNNNEYLNLKLEKKYRKKLRKLNQNLSNKVVGSSNRNKARKKLGKLNEKIHNIKENYLHHTVNSIIDDNQVIIIENLNISGMMKNHKLAKSISDLSLNRFKQILTYKSEWYGRTLVEIDRWYPSSKKCSSCGNVKKDLKLSDRLYKCTECNLEIGRDYNAALNIKAEGIRLLTTNTV